MKRPIILPALCATLTLTGCGSEKTSGNQQDTTQTAISVTREPYADRERNTTHEAQMGSHQYSIAIHQSPDKSLPTVKDALDQEFYDNRIEVKITRDGDEEIFAHDFSKDAFADHIGKNEIGKFILSGMGFDESASANGYIVLTAQVGEPGSEDVQPFRISIPTSGRGFSIEPGVMATMDIPMEEAGD